MAAKDWVWMPHPAHFICGSSCQFRLATMVNGLVISTIGEYLPSEGVREIIARSRGVTLQGQGDARLADYMKQIGYEDIGLDRKYETMVFPAKKRNGTLCGCLFEPSEWAEIACDRYNTAEEAYAGHMEMCSKADAGEIKGHAQESDK